MLGTAGCESDRTYPINPVPDWWETVVHVQSKGNIYAHVTIYKDTKSCSTKSCGDKCRHYMLQRWGVHNSTLIEIDYVPTYEELDRSLNRIASAKGN